MTVISRLPIFVSLLGLHRTRGRERSEGSAPLENVEDVVRAAQGGDPRAMDALMRELSPRLGRICAAISPQHGEDALQEALIAVLRNVGSLREPAAIHGWARRIAVRESIRVARRAATSVPVADIDRTSAVDVEAASDVRAVLATMAPEQRAILVLRDLEGMSEEDASVLLQSPVGTVKSRLHRARRAFRERWTA
jgi:RNA polymerase sigma-70 factor (ECF subfamily)